MGEQNEQNWQLFFMLLPVLVFSRLGLSLSEELPMKIVLGILLGAGGAILGLGLYFFIKKRGGWQKLFILFLFAALCLLAFFLIIHGLK